jgi:3-keto-L-gulonate-6-phosphate decarboxylase
MSYILTDKAQLEKAILRAKKIKPLVRMIEFGTYSVRSSDGQSFYTVRLSRNSLGEKVVDCDCKGGERGLVCFHSVSCLELHGTIAKRRVEVGR